MRKLTCALLMLIAASPAAHGVETGNPARGLAYARQNCAECHAVEPTDTMGPFSDLPTFREIANTPGMSELALISFFQTPHPTMPDFVVTGGDVQDLIAYLATLKN